MRKKNRLCQFEARFKKNYFLLSFTASNSLLALKKKNKDFSNNFRMIKLTLFSFSEIITISVEAKVDRLRKLARIIGGDKLKL